MLVSRLQSERRAVDEMDGPIDGPASAFAALAKLNPMASTAGRPKSAPAGGGAGGNAETAFVLLRPAAVKGSLVSEICQRFEKRGLALSAMRMLKPGAEIAKQHYTGISTDKSVLAELVSDLAPGPALAMLWRGANAMDAVRAIVGDDDPLKALPGTVRGDLSSAFTADQLVELARDAKDVARLTDVWFEASDLAHSAKSSAAAAPAASASSAAPLSGKAAKKAAAAEKNKAAGGAGGAGTAMSPEVLAKFSHAVRKPTADPKLGRFYITTAINYANGAPHMGHAYEAVAADVIARYHRLFGREVFFLTGADEHGQKIADKAAEVGMTPIQVCDKHVEQFKHLDGTLDVEFDGYVRTTADQHKELSRALWTRCEKKGGVYLDKYVGWYNVREETFVTETDAAANDFKDPVSGKDLKKMEEPSYFFRLSAYQERLIQHITEHPEFITPEKSRNEILEKLREPLRDLSVSRTTFSWGIPVPGDVPGHVMYVWFDALSNYLTGVGWDASKGDPSKASSNAKFWPADIHLIGKDIVWFHCVIWPAMLMCAEAPLPKTVLAHGFVHGADGKKMSKSIGNVVDPYDVLQRFPVDSFRFFLMRDAPFGGDINFSETALALRHNAELADTFGNLVHRSLALCAKYNGGKVPEEEADMSVLDVGALRTASEEAYKAHQLDVAAGLAIGGLNAANKYVTDSEPWHLKEGDKKRLVVVRTVLECIYACCHFLAPFVLDGATKAFAKLNAPPTLISKLRPTLSNLTPGTQCEVGGEVLYQKAETAEALAEQKKQSDLKKKAIADGEKKRAAKEAAAKGVAAGGGGGDAAGSEFSKVDLRVGKIVEVARHPEADALYVEKIDLGEASGPRQVVSGLVKFIPQEQMQDRRVVVVANLKTSKLKGVESQAMVLCGKSADGTTMELLTPPEGVPLGERVVAEGHAAEPEAQLNPKKKIWEKVQPMLSISSAKVACFEATPLMTSKGPCVVDTLTGGAIG